VDFEIRPFHPKDFDALWRLDQSCFPPGIAYSRQELMSYIGRRSSFTLVAERADGRAERAKPAPPWIGGFLVAESGRQAGHIITIDVRAEARRCGLGSRLMQEAEIRLQAAGCKSVELETAVDNRAALAFYKRQGYFLVRSIPRYYATGVDAFVLKKELPSPVPAS
jgi:ribosomal-protein-alanine N-acetyltransferase